MFGKKQEVVELGRTLISDDYVRDCFLESALILKEKRASVGLYFELLHEFGHIDKGVLAGAIPVYVKIEKHGFVFVDQDIRYVKSKGFSSSVLMYFDNDEDLSDKWIRAVRGGLEFTTAAQNIKTISIRSRLFNKTNNLDSNTISDGSDHQLLEKLKDSEFAIDFNKKAKGYYEEFIETGLI